MSDEALKKLTFAFTLVWGLVSWIPVTLLLLGNYLLWGQYSQFAAATGWPSLSSGYAITIGLPVNVVAAILVFLSFQKKFNPFLSSVVAGFYRWILIVVVDAFVGPIIVNFFLALSGSNVSLISPFGTLSYLSEFLAELPLMMLAYFLGLFLSSILLHSLGLVEKNERT